MNDKKNHACVCTTDDFRIKIWDNVMKKTAKDCTEKKEIIHSQKQETLLKEKSTLV